MKVSSECALREPNSPGGWRVNPPFRQGLNRIPARTRGQYVSAVLCRFEWGQGSGDWGQGSFFQGNFFQGNYSQELLQ